MISIKRNWVAPAALYILAATYYSILSAKSFTWILGSGDSGGWLTSFISWQTPQPFGNPIYVLLGHLLAWFPGDLVIKATIIGGCLASAATISVVYLISLRYTKSYFSAALTGGLLLSSAVFLSQSIVLSQYPLAVLMAVLATWFYLTDRRVLTVLCIGLGTAMHFMNGAIAVLWLAIEWRNGNIRNWLRWIPLFAAISIIPYTLTLWELWRENGTLSLTILSHFTSNTSGAGGLVVVAFPERVLRFLSFVLPSLGIAIIPIWYGWRQKQLSEYWILLMPILLVSWYYLTAQDTTVWHYLPWIMPFLVIFAGIGMSSALNWKPMRYLMVSWVAIILGFNSIFLNANFLSEQSPNATSLYNSLKALPQNSVVEANHMGWVGFTVRYVQASERPDIRIVAPATDKTYPDSGGPIFTISADGLSVTEVQQ